MRPEEVGGDSTTIAAGGTALGRQSRNLGAAVAPLKGALTSAAGACGAVELQEAIDRCSAAWSTEVNDISIGLRAAAELATNAAADLQAVGGH